MDKGLLIEGVTKAYGGKPVLAGVDLHVPAGQIIGVLGVNGTGKTTLARIASGLLKPDSGAVRLEGREPSRHTRALVGVTLPDAGWDQLHSAQELVELHCRLFGWSLHAARERARSLLLAVGLGPVAERRVRTYSFGMKRRLDFTLATAHDPPILVLDEPTNGIDIRGRETIWNEIRRQRSVGKAILLFSQDMDEVEHCADLVGFLVTGRLGAHQTPADVRRLSGSFRVRLRLGKEGRPQQALQVLREAGVLAGDAEAFVGDEHLEITGGTDMEAMARLSTDAVSALTRADHPVFSVSIAPPTLEQAVAQRI